MSPELAQFLGSLVAILALAGIARMLRLGGNPRIVDPAHARKLADEAVSGFDARAISIDCDGQAAILRDPAGRVLILRRHGGKFAGRLLGPGSAASLKGSQLQVTSGEALFGTISLTIDDPAPWLTQISGLGEARHA